MKHTSIPAAADLRKAIHDGEIAAQALRDAGLDERASKLEEHITNARKQKFSIGVVAQAKRGKSTLINGLLGRNDDLLAPIDRFPATNVVSCFANGKEENARVLFQGDDDGSPGRTIEFRDIGQYSCEEHNPNNEKGVNVLEVVGSFPLLSEDVVLVDTPGANNALTRVHDLMLLEFLPKLDAVVFLVTADAPLVASELELLKLIRKSDVRKLLFAMNKVDAVDGEELQQALQHNRKVLAEAGFDDAPIFKISAKTFHQTGADPDTERLIGVLGETINSGRAGVIAERLAAVVESYITEASTEIQTALECSEMTLEQIGERRSQLEELRRDVERGRETMEMKFRTAWRGAFDKCERALQPLRQQMVREYTELVESTPAFELSEVGGMIHTDVLKRLDELLQPHADELANAVTGATMSLQVDVLGSMGIEPREASQIVTRKQGLTDVAGVALAGAPAIAGAVLVGTLPGLVSSAVLASAPAVVALAWNPLTWGPAVGAGAIGIAGGTIAVLLAPIAVVGTPVLIGYAGLRVFSAWRYKVSRTRNELALAVRDLIVGAIDETRGNLRSAKAADEGILEEFRANTATRIGEAKRKLDDLEKSRPTPERLAELRMASKLIGHLRPPVSLPEPQGAESDRERLFP